MRVSIYIMRWKRLRWFDHVHRKPIDTLIRRINCLEIRGISTGSGKIKKTLIDS